MLNNNCKANYYYYFYSVRPNIFVGRVEGSAVYQKWYFEVTLDHMEQTTHMTPHLRIGWANTAGLDTVFFVFFYCLQFPQLLIFILLYFFSYVPYPGGGEKWGGNGVGDDLYSYGFDGAALWTG